MDRLRLEQNIVVLKRELMAERNKFSKNQYQKNYEKLSQCYPMLSTNDLKICHYLMLNYTSKQISQQLNITIDGVYAARKRIRKKLGLSANDNLIKALINCRKQC